MRTLWRIVLSACYASLAACRGSTLESARPPNGVSLPVARTQEPDRVIKSSSSTSQLSPTSAFQSAAEVSEAIQRAAPSQMCHFESNGRQIEVGLVGHWVTTVKTTDTQPTLVSGSPIPFGPWLGVQDSTFPRMIIICSAHGGGVPRTKPDVGVSFVETKDAIRARVEFDSGKGLQRFSPWGELPYANLECAPMSPRDEAHELATAWRRTFRSDAAKALNEARVGNRQVVLYFRGPDCPDCERVERGVLSWPGIRGRYAGDWVVVDGTPSPSVAPAPREDGPEVRARFGVRAVPTLIVYDYDKGDHGELLRFNGYFSAEDLVGAPMNNGRGEGRCSDVDYLRP